MAALYSRLMNTYVQIRHGESSGAATLAKEQVLFAKIAEQTSLLVALSGGTDSAYLAWAAHQVFWRGIPSR